MTTFKLKIQDLPEDKAQQLLVQWMIWAKIPVIHIPNEGKRNYALAAWLKAMGLRAGCYDLFIPRARKGYHGYWIEMKKHGKKPTELQAAFGEEMKAEGYKADWFDNWETAKLSVEEYLRDC